MLFYLRKEAVTLDINRIIMHKRRIKLLDIDHGNFKQPGPHLVVQFRVMMGKGDFGLVVHKAPFVFLTRRTINPAKDQIPNPRPRSGILLILIPFSITVINNENVIGIGNAFYDPMLHLANRDVCNSFADFHIEAPGRVEPNTNSSWSEGRRRNESMLNRKRSAIAADCTASFLTSSKFELPPSYVQ